ncbi:transposase, partial [Shewanella sp. NIFS-20-20]|nr:transposase [Shewanella sp. NIFS-20-20]
APTLEQSHYTSIQLRLQAALSGQQPASLMQFTGNECDNQPNGLHFDVKDYLELIEDTGRIVRNDKRGSINNGSSRVLERLNISPENWLKLATEFGQLFHGPAGNTQELDKFCEHLQKRRRHFVKSCQYLNTH